MATLSTYLAQARERLRSVTQGQDSGSDDNDDGTVTFVVGNESADLDSLCSSLVLAYFNSQEALSAAAAVTSSSSSSSQPHPSSPKNTLHIPLCHLPRADLALRPEFTAVLRQADLTPEELITLDDIPFPSSVAEADSSNSNSNSGGGGGGGGGNSRSGSAKPSLDPSLTRWVLVDHNVLTGRLAREFLSPFASAAGSSSASSSAGRGKVVSCIDHHDDEGKLPADCEPRIIEKSGSCMSLVVEHCKAIWEDAAVSSSSAAKATPDQQQQQQQKESRKKLNDQLARVVLAPILIDTNDLRDANKTTEHDTQVVGWLEQTKLVRRKDDDAGGDGTGKGDEGKGKGFDRTAYFDHIQHLKNDISQMSLRDVLRKDYKEWTETPTPSSSSSSISLSGPAPPPPPSTMTLRLGTMSCSCRIGYLLEHTCQNDAQAFVRGMREWIAEKELDVAAIMSAYEDEETGGGFKRELFLWAVTTRGGGSGGGGNGGGHEGAGGKGIEAAEKFVADYDGQLKLMPWEGGRLDTSTGGDSKDGFRRCWTQGTTKFSRKQVAPMLREAMRGVLG